MLITDLGGHSGCTIMLCEEDDHVFVRKISKSKAYNPRLLVQKEKQENFKANVIKAPRVFADGYTQEGMYYFDMEYIQGITLSEYIRTVRIIDVEKIVETLVDELAKTGDLGSAEEIDINGIFQDKIQTLFDQLAGKNEVIDDALLMLKNHEWFLFEKTTCHGDLTLENIIIKNGQLYLIDFLDSFFDSWLLDMGTLMQDVQALWSYRFDNPLDINTVLRLMMFRDLLLDNMKVKMGDSYYELYYALLLKLVRILPYTKDKNTYNFLVEKIQSVMDVINKGDK